MRESTWKNMEDKISFQSWNPWNTCKVMSQTGYDQVFICFYHGYSINDHVVDLQTPCHSHGSKNESDGPHGPDGLGRDFLDDCIASFWLAHALGASCLPGDWSWVLTAGGLLSWKIWKSNVQTSSQLILNRKNRSYVNIMLTKPPVQTAVPCGNNKLGRLHQFQKLGRRLKSIEEGLPLLSWADLFSRFYMC